MKKQKLKSNYKKYNSVYYREKHSRIKQWVIFAVVAVFVIGFAVYSVASAFSKDAAMAVVQNEIQMERKTSQNDIKETKNSTKEIKEEKITPSKVSIVAVGDNLVSDSVLYTAKRNGGGKYDFSSVFEKMKSDFQAADIAIINQETMLGGKSFEYQGYPTFNTPNSMGKALIDAGFDIVQCASNHSMDTKVEGMQHAIKYWKKQANDIMMVGLNESEEEYNTIPIYECKGIKFAVLNYTYGLNGFTVPDEYSYIVNMMDKKHWKKVKSDIEKAEELADFTIVLPHWGQEYVQPDPTDEQVKWAEMMTKAGADLIIGTHPHVVEKVEWIKTENGNKSLCYYSIGNYTSGQQQWETLLGGMATLTVKKDSKGTRIVKKSAKVVPIITHYVWGTSDDVVRQQYTYKLSDYSQSLLSNCSIQWYDPVTYEDYENLAEEVFGKFLKK